MAKYEYLSQDQIQDTKTIASHFDLKESELLPLVNFQAITNLTIGANLRNKETLEEAKHIRAKARELQTAIQSFQRRRGITAAYILARIIKNGAKWPHELPLGYTNYKRIAMCFDSMSSTEKQLSTLIETLNVALTMKANAAYRPPKNDYVNMTKQLIDLWKNHGKKPSNSVRSKFALFLDRILLEVFAVELNTPNLIKKAMKS